MPLELDSTRAPDTRSQDKLREDAQRNTSRNFQNIGKELRGLFQSFKRGGRVKRTGLYRVHRGERVIPRGRRRGRR